MIPAPLRARSFAKINVALSVLGRRTDGYHDIQTVFQSIDLCDELEFRPAAQLELQCDSFPDLRAEGTCWGLGGRSPRLRTRSVRKSQRGRPYARVVHRGAYRPAGTAFGCGSAALWK